MEMISNNNMTFKSMSYYCSIYYNFYIAQHISDKKYTMTQNSHLCVSVNEDVFYGGLKKVNTSYTIILISRQDIKHVISGFAGVFCGRGQRCIFRPFSYISSISCLKQGTKRALSTGRA